MQQFTITLLRHGETVAPSNLNGATDVALSALGKQQMLNAASKLNDIDCVVTSPLQRCCILAKIIASQWQVSLSIEQQFAEMNFGDWDGQPFDELYQQSPTQMDKFWRTPWDVTVPNGEQLSDFQQRIDKAWHRLLTQQKNTLVVCHGGVIRYIIAKILNLGKHNNSHITALKIDFAAIVRIQITIDDDQYYPMLLWP